MVKQHNFDPITIVVLTKNEANQIAKCLDSIKNWADEIIVVDDSTDTTLEQVKKQISPTRLKIIRPAEKVNFSALRNTALNAAVNKWVLFIDADEVVTDELRQEISQVLLNTSNKGYYIKRQDFFLGRWLKHGETGNIKLLKLAQRNAGIWQRTVHETWHIDGNAGILKNPLLHFPHPTVSEFISHINRWTSLDAQYFYDNGVRSSAWQIIAFPTAKLIVNYVFKFGFLDGMPGLIFALCMSFHSFLTRAKLYLKTVNN